MEGRSINQRNPKRIVLRFKKALINLGLLIVSTIIFLTIGEIIVRLITKDRMVLFPRYHTAAQYGEYTLRMIRPHSVFWHTSPDGSWKFTTNNKGFRNYSDFEYNKSEGLIRILCIGDSQTQGYEVRQEYTFSAIIAKYLKTKGLEVEVINAGISGYSTAEELIFFENEGIKYNPDYLVLGFFANDFQDNVKSELFKLDTNWMLHVQKQSHTPGVKIQDFLYKLPLTKWLSENSYFYSLLFNTTWRYFKTRLANSASERVFEYAIATQDDFSDYQTELTTALIQQMYNSCQENGIKLLIVDIPSAGDEGHFKSSFTDSLVQTIEVYSDGFIYSDSLFADYRGTAQFHRPRGHRHISEFTHIMIGVETAKMIASLMQKRTREDDSPD